MAAKGRYVPYQYSLRTLMVLVAIVCVLLGNLTYQTRNSVVNALRVGDGVDLEHRSASDKYVILMGASNTKYKVAQVGRDFVKLTHQDFDLVLPVSSIYYIKREIPAGTLPATPPTPVAR